MSEQPDIFGGDESLASELGLLDYAKALQRRWRLVAACILVAAVGAAVQAFLSEPKYRATATIKVEPEKVSLTELGLNPAYFYGTSEFLPTQLALIRSREIAERVVRKLNLTENADFNPARARRGDKAPSEARRRSEVVSLARRIQAGITASVVKDTSLIELGFVASNPKVAADVVNGVAEAYIEWSSASRIQEMGQTSKFLATQIEQLKAELDEKEKKLTEFGLSKDIYTTDPQTNTALQKIDALNKDLSSATGDRVAKEAKHYEMQAATPEALADTLSPAIVQLRNEQAKLEREYEQKLNLYKPEWPAMQQLKLQVTRGRQHLEEMIRDTVAKAREATKNEYQSALRREEGLKEEMRLLRNEAAKLNSSVVEFTNLRVEVANRRTLLDSMMKRQSETEMGVRISTVEKDNIRVVDRADPPGAPFAPSYERNITSALGLGLLGGIGLVLLLEQLDRSLKSTEDVERRLKVPALGVVPALNTREGKVYGYGYGYGYGRSRKAPPPPAEGPEEPLRIELIPHDKPRCLAAEAYRAFRTALLLSRAGGVHTVVVSSTFPSEGKTATSANLAVVLAQLKRNVLLVDSDLHKPRLHEVFRLPNRKGLVSILAEGARPDEIIIGTSVPGVSLLPAGPLSPNPSGLLSSDAMSQFLAWTRERYDYVVIDSPPIQAVADGLILGSQSDGVILCVHGGKTSRDQVVRVRNRLYKSNVRVLGVLLNQLEDSAVAYGTGKYGYGYGYYGRPESEGDATSKEEKKVASA